jgi:hypothetical protein
VALLAEVVDDADFMAALNQLAGDLTADETGASGDNHSPFQGLLQYRRELEGIIASRFRLT